jgi:aspartate/tyrosine/aromatic aminotransferase
VQWNEILKVVKANRLLPLFDSAYQVHHPHLKYIQGTFKEHSRNIQGTSKEHSWNIQG